MNHSILLITGWGGGTQLLHPLKQALQHNGHTVDVINIFDAFDSTVLQEKVELARHYEVIIGWSLGGQLAAVLVNEIDKQYGEQKILISLASNPCFVANDFWHSAMSVTTFKAFKQAFENDAISTLKRFGYMVCQGVTTTKADLLTLQSLIQPQSMQLLKQGLKLLEKLNVVEILKYYSGQQYHIFASKDALVTYQVVDNLRNLTAKFLTLGCISGSHGFPVFQSADTSASISEYLKKIKQSPS